MTVLTLTIILICFTAVVNVGILVATCIIWRGCMKMYTEYFKDVSAHSRKEVPK